MNQEDKEQKQNYQARLEGKRPSSQVSVLLENHINHFFLAWLCHPSRKRMFLQSEQKYDWRSDIYISLLQNECNLFRFQQRRKQQK